MCGPKDVNLLLILCFAQSRRLLITPFFVMGILFKKMIVNNFVGFFFLSFLNPSPVKLVSK